MICCTAYSASLSLSFRHAFENHALCNYSGSTASENQYFAFAGEQMISLDKFGWFVWGGAIAFKWQICLDDFSYLNFIQSTSAFTKFRAAITNRFDHRSSSINSRPWLCAEVTWTLSTVFKGHSSFHFLTNDRLTAVRTAMVWLPFMLLLISHAKPVTILQFILAATCANCTSSCFEFITGSFFRVYSQVSHFVEHKYSVACCHWIFKAILFNSCSSLINLENSWLDLPQLLIECESVR